VSSCREVQPRFKVQRLVPECRNRPQRRVGDRAGNPAERWMSANKSTDATLSVILVHGTWGRGIFVRTDRPWLGPPYWFNKASPFRKRLEEELSKRDVTPQIKCISWSGSNSVFARSAAASKLRDQLVAAPQDPGCPLYPRKRAPLRRART
jgi:hypothetical protein